MARLLPEVARRIFTVTFGDRYEAGPFSAFCDAVYGPGGTMEQDLTDETVHWRVAVAQGALVGYAKLTPLRAPFASAAPNAMELQQIYVLPVWHGSGVAEQLMDWAIQTAQRKNAPELYLTVFDHNERAKRFYARHDFVEVGHCTFTLGDRVDDDRVWRRRVAASD